MSAGDPSSQSSPLDAAPAESQGGLTALERTRITVSTRPHWHQVTPFTLESPELAERMRAIARADWQRFKGYRRIEVTAADNDGRVSTYTIEPWPGVCPHCGRSL